MSHWKNHWKLIVIRFLACVGAFSLALLAFGIFGLFWAGSWLNAPDPVEKSDALAVLSGAPERTMFGADLFHRELAPEIYIGRPARERSHRTLEAFGVIYTTETEINRAILKQRGVPEAAIRIYGKASINTQEELENIQTALPTAAKSLIIVTSPFHIRRTKILATRVFAGRAMRIVVVAGPYEPYPDHWWQDQEAARQTISELAKITFFWLGGNFSGK